MLGARRYSGLSKKNASNRQKKQKGREEELDPDDETRPGKRATIKSGETGTENRGPAEATECVGYWHKWDEKGYAKRLHALKMLEKYYTFMSGEELELLERILEDCKRRKREYAMDED